PYCHDGSCSSQECWSDEDCNLGITWCNDGQCEPNCDSDEDCEPGEVCYPGADYGSGCGQPEGGPEPDTAGTGAEPDTAGAGPEPDTAGAGPEPGECMTDEDCEDEAGPILAAKCAPCHTGGTGLGGHNIGDTPGDATNMASHDMCGGQNVAECVLTRIESGDMPQGCGGVVADDDEKAGSCITESNFAVLQSWADGLTE
ncbi:MAG: hypothetical protein QF464_24530, partial [Myxococcota bacterium]|nr:hypothetical protein [Myxococcota bacterium]